MIDDGPPRITRRDIGNFVAGRAPVSILCLWLMSCPANGAANSCADIPAPPADLLPYDGPLARLVKPLPQVGIICRSFGVLDSRTICGCSVWGHDQKRKPVMIQIIADVPER